jgi:hypothetical protein
MTPDRIASEPLNRELWQAELARMEQADDPRENRISRHRKRLACMQAARDAVTVYWFARLR